MVSSKARRTLVVGSRAQPLLSLCAGGQGGSLMVNSKALVVGSHARLLSLCAVGQGLASVCLALLIHVVGMSLSLRAVGQGVR